MPTPRDSTDELPLQTEQLSHPSCPPENDRPAEWRVQTLNRLGLAVPDNMEGEEQRLQEEHKQQDGEQEALTNTPLEPREITVTDQNASTESGESNQPQLVASPYSSYGEEREAEPARPCAPTSRAIDLKWSSRYNIESRRLIQTHTSCMLRAGSKFRGTQTSEQQRYNVEVYIKSVDMSESFLCGYLKIEGLTPEHATLTTYFEGEIIGPRYTFQTRHESWGASERDDMKHWNEFQAWRPLSKQAKKSTDFHYKNSTNRENVFMRWKEKFLVPDYRVKEISGASFEGFYYICFNQVAGTIEGIYYHSKSIEAHNNKIQKLELKWIDDRGCFSAMEFR